ncbi:helix-turn-helix transcriptional regulator [Chloroflexota bacterium]
MRRWSFITNHGLVLATIAGNPDSTARAIGDTVGITERAVHRIIADLEDAGYITKGKSGRRNAYSIHADIPLNEIFGQKAATRDLLKMLGLKAG